MSIFNCLFPCFNEGEYQEVPQKKRDPRQEGKHPHLNKLASDLAPEYIVKRSKSIRGYNWREEGVVFNFVEDSSGPDTVQVEMCDIVKDAPVSILVKSFFKRRYDDWPYYPRLYEFLTKRFNIYNDLIQYIVDNRNYEELPPITEKEKQWCGKCLLGAVKTHNIAVVRLFCKLGADPNFVLKRSDDSILANSVVIHQTPLTIAVSEGQEEIVTELIEFGADVDFSMPLPADPVRRRVTPLHVAAENNFTSIAAQLLDNGAYVEYETLDGNTPLHFASDHNKLEISRLLLERGANPNLRNDNGETPFDLAMVDAVNNRCYDLIEIMLTYRADPTAPNRMGHSAIHQAVINADLVLLKLLCRSCDHIRELETTDHDHPPLSFSPLHYAIKRNRTDLVSCLLEFGAAENMSESHTNELLKFAQLIGNDRIIELISSINRPHCKTE